MQELNLIEINEISGGIPALALYVFYVAGGTAGVTAGWTFARALLCDK